MAQQTTREFGRRLQQALDASPHAVPVSHGRLSWLKRELEKTGVSVSVNTVHKWVHGVSRPREDNIRALARLLRVDEVWLALGQTPAPSRANTGAETARGAALLVAGLIEVKGGRVTFAPTGQQVPHFTAHYQGERFDVIAVSPQPSKGDELSFVVPGPVGTSRIMAVVAARNGPVALLDITGARRETVGGFCVVALTRGQDGKLSDGAGKEIAVADEIV